MKRDFYAALAAAGPDRAAALLELVRDEEAELLIEQALHPAGRGVRWWTYALGDGARVAIVE